MSGQGSSGYQALRTAVAAYGLPRDVVRLSGPDALAYLQGQCSQDVSLLAVGGTADALLLSPQGKVDAFVRVTRTGDEELVLDADAGAGPLVQARLERFRLRVKAAVELLEGWACVAVRGPEVQGTAAGDAVSTVPDRSEGAPGAAVLRLPVSWPAFSGFDLLGPWSGDGSALDAWVAPGVVRCGGEAWEAARIEAGVPAHGREVTEATIPAEVGLVDRSVSFTKGCFTGQELVARLDARGSNVARRLRGLVIGADVIGPDAPGTTPGGDAMTGLPPIGAGVTTPDGDHEVGHLTSVAWSPGLGTGVGLAVLHRRVSPPGGVVLRWTAGGTEHLVEAEARELPLIGPDVAPSG